MKRTLVFSLATVLVTTLALAGPALAGGKGKAKGKSKICRSTVTYVLEGPALVVDPAGSVTMTVAESNKHARSFVGRDVTVTTNATTKIVRDDVKATLADLVAGDVLTVKIRGCKGIDPGTLALVAKHINAVSPPAEETPVV